MNDFVTCAPSKNVGGENAGRLYVYSGGTGALLWSVDGAPGDQLGMGVEAAGDVNGDGIADVVASALGIDTAYVYSGADGRLLLTLTGARAGGGGVRHHPRGGRGRTDLIVGTWQYSVTAQSAGRAYLFDGRSGKM